MINKKVARRYTLALHAISEERTVTDLVKSDVSLFKKAIEDSRELKTFLHSPVINARKKKAVLEQLFGDKVNELTLKFILILADKGRESYLYDISVDFLNLVNEKRGIVTANIRTAIELTESEKKNLESKLKEYTGKQINAHFTIDKSIKGGFVAQVHDTIIDASIKRQLEMLYEHFKQGSFTNN
ncbi:MAG: ATP synthase F1 subunit delta [Ignavibacteriae bacterium]|nr:MAG: ATP synthase F1 subunit delta [Ignavibacteriota bacterium]